MKGLDLSRLKKVASDDKTTTFRHDMGHEIKIVHSMLSPKMLKEVQGINMARGGEIAADEDAPNVKGVHKSFLAKNDAGMSESGIRQRQGRGEEAVEKHKEVLSEMRSMPKPELYASGGETGVNKETTKKGVSEAGAKLNPAFSVGGKKWDTENAKDEHKKTLSELQSIPKPQLYAPGGDATPDPQPNASPDSSAPAPQAPVNIYLGGQGQQQSGPQPDAQAAATPQQMGPPAPAGTPPSSPDTNPPDQATAPMDNQAPAIQGQSVATQPEIAAMPPTAGQILSQPTSAGDALAHLNDQSAKLRADYNNGLITPKTYQDLFNDKGTLGKIGTIFGLLVGGAGSGLAHQQNALLAMMDKTIDRDLEGQKQTKTNQFNALSLAERHYQDEVQSHLTNAQAAQANQNTALAKVNTDIASITKAKENMYYSVEQQALRAAGRLPPNTPTGQKAQAMAGVVSNAVTAKVAQDNAQTAQQIEMNGKQSASQQASEPYEESNGMRTYPVLAPNAVQNSVASTYLPFINQPKLQTQLTKADQVSKVLNGPTGNGEGGIHDLLQNMYQDIGEGSQTGSLEQRIKGAIGHIPYVGDIGEKGANAIFSGTGYKDYASKKTGMIQDLSTALSGLVAPTDIIKLVDDNLPIHGDTPEDVDNKERQIYNGIMKAMPTDELQKAGLLARKR